jgi:hypothetical protein
MAILFCLNGTHMERGALEPEIATVGTLDLDNPLSEDREIAAGP